MKEIFIVSKNPDLPNYLFVLIKEIIGKSVLKLSLGLSEKLDLIILDTETIDSTEAARFQIGVPVVLFSNEIKPRLISYTARYDINGIFSLKMESKDLLKTFHSALEGDIFYPDSMISMLFSNKINELSEKVGSLTERETEIIVMMMKDLTNEEIARDLDLSMRTVNAHKGNIMRKIGAKTTSGLIQIVLEYSSTLKNQF